MKQIEYEIKVDDELLQLIMKKFDEIEARIEKIEETKEDKAIKQLKIGD